MKSDAVILYIYNNSLVCFSRAESVGCSKNIFAVFAKKERTNFFFFLIFLTNRQTKQKDRPNRSIASFFHTDKRGGVSFETSFHHRE